MVDKINPNIIKAINYGYRDPLLERVVISPRIDGVDMSSIRIPLHRGHRR